MQKRYCFSVVLIFITGISYCQSNAIPDFRFEEDATIQINETNALDSYIEFAVYDGGKIIIYNGRAVGYRAGDVVGFCLKKSKKQFLSASITANSGSQFVEDLTPDRKKIKVVKSFIADLPFIKKDSVVMGKWVYHFLLVKEDGSKRLISNFTKLAEEIKADCPDLSKKIIAKDEGYFLNPEKNASTEIEVYFTIVNEFANCKQK